MRSIIGSTFQTLDGVVEAPERWGYGSSMAKPRRMALELTDTMVLGSGTVILTYTPARAEGPNHG